MTRVPDDLAQELVEWAAAKSVVIRDGEQYCLFCKKHHPMGEPFPHDECLRTRAMYWLAAEKATRDWTPRAVEVGE